MRTILNVIWLLFGGIWLALGYYLVGILACVLIVTIPVGVAAFRMGSYALWPFGKTVIDKPRTGVGSALMNVIWFVIGGLPLAIGHLTTAAAQAITIVGIPLAGSVESLNVAVAAGICLYATRVARSRR